MKNIWKKGDQKTFIRIVRPEDIAEFEAGEVHAFYSTFALSRDAEWAGRLFVLEMLEPHEEGIGTSLQVKHRSPALVGQEVVITSEIEEIVDNKITCSFTAKVQDRLVATGTTGQMILTKEQVNQIEEKAK